MSDFGTIPPPAPPAVDNPPDAETGAKQVRYSKINNNKELLDRIKAGERWMICLTSLIFCVSAFQAFESWSNNRATTIQVDRLIDSAYRVGGAAESFALSSANINRGVMDAVDKIQAQADAVERSRLTSEVNSKAALDATIAQSELDERGWVGVANLTVSVDPTQPIKVSTRVVALGKSPAFDVTVKQGLIFLPKAQPVRLSDLVLSRPILHEGTVSPNTSFPIREDGASPMTAEEKAAIGFVLDKSYIAYYFGEVSYSDIFDFPHWTDFCYAITSGNSEDSAPCGLYDKSDKSKPQESIKHH